MLGDTDSCWQLLLDVVSEINSRRRQKKACLLQEGRGNTPGVSKYGGRIKTLKFILIMQKESQPSYIHIHTEFPYGMSLFSSRPEYFIIISLFGPINRPGHENNSAVLSYGWCTFDMAAEFTQLDTEPCH